METTKNRTLTLLNNTLSKRQLARRHMLPSFNTFTIHRKHLQTPKTELPLPIPINPYKINIIRFTISIKFGKNKNSPIIRTPNVLDNMTLTNMN